VTDADALPQGIDTVTLTGPMRRALASDSLLVITRTARRLGGGVGNPVSLGLWHLSGTATDQGRTLPWSLVPRLAQSLTKLGAVDRGEGNDRAHWNYASRQSSEPEHTG
jgi:hypothetical protein